MSESKQKVHFIAVGGSVMHNLALALQKKGFQVSGSDVEIHEPSKSRLSNAGLLPEAIGWNTNKITKDIDAVILTAHVAIDNPELKKAQELGLKIYSFPEYIYNQCTDKQRIVITGSHGKTSIVSMILHVLKFHNKKFDFVTCEILNGFDTNVKLTEEAPLIIIEGDESRTTSLDPSPNFLHYKHHIGLISGVAWDKINLYPSKDEYKKQFELFADVTPKGGSLVYCEEDDTAKEIAKKNKGDFFKFGYEIHKCEIKENKTFLVSEAGKFPVFVFGKHMMMNISAAKTVCSRIGITEENFYEAITQYKPAANLLEEISKSDCSLVIKDQANSPTKLKATTLAVKKQFPKRDLVAVYELNTSTSLHKNFISQYKNSLNEADVAVLYYNPQLVKEKNLPDLSEKDITSGFNSSKLKVFTEKQLLKDFLLKMNWKNKNLLFMSSGNFNGLELTDLAKEIVKK